MRHIKNAYIKSFCTISANLVHEFHSPQQTDRASVPKTDKWMQLVAYGPKPPHYHRRGLLMSGWMEPLLRYKIAFWLESQEIHIWSAGNCHNAEPRHIWHSLKLGTEEWDVNEGMCHYQTHLDVLYSCAVYQFLQDIFFRSWVGSKFSSLCDKITVVSGLHWWFHHVCL